MIIPYRHRVSDNALVELYDHLIEDETPAWFLGKYAFGTVLILDYSSDEMSHEHDKWGL